MIAVLLSSACASPDRGAASSSADASTGSTAPGSSSTASAEAGADTGPGSSGSTTGVPPRACNGEVAWCERRVDEVTFPTTHNAAAAAEYGFSPFNTNQTHGLRRQLDDGIRGMMLDVTEFEGDTWLCHGPCGLGKLRHTDALTIVGQFLDEHPHEVLLIVYEDTATAQAIAADWQALALEPLLFAKGDGPWPTLGALIDADTRVIVMAENGAPPPPWFHHAWSLMWDTPYSFHALDEFSCEANRGSPGEGLLLVNHWISTDADLPDPDSAAAANAHAALLGHAQACAEQWQHAVNLLAVDFYEQGELFAVVDALSEG